MSVNVDIQMPDFTASSLKALMDLPLLIAATVQTQRGMIFDNEGAYNGRPRWEPLKFRQGQILKDKGTLSKSIAPQNNGIKPSRAEGTILESAGDMVRVGTKIPYAETHELGATIKPKQPGGLLHFQVPVYTTTKSGKTKQKGTRWIHAHQVVIPARPFGNITDQDANELAETIANYYESII